MKTEKIEYLVNSQDKQIDMQIQECEQKINDLGIQYSKIKKSKTIENKKSKLDNIARECAFYLNKYNNLTRKLYR